MKIFYNISNHPSAKWGARQHDAAAAMGNVTDIAFPAVPTAASTDEVRAMAAEIADQIEPDAYALVAGEFSLVYALTSMLISKGVTVLAACSDRNAEEVVQADGTTKKVVVFDFVQFREVR